MTATRISRSQQFDARVYLLLLAKHVWTQRSTHHASRKSAYLRYTGMVLCCSQTH